MRPFISIVRVVKNDYQNLIHSIPLILKQDVSLAYEIIVIDSGSRDGSVEFIKRMSKIDDRLSLYEIPSEEFHHARTRNLGISLSRSDIVVCLNGDAIPCDEHWLNNIVLPVINGGPERIAASYGKQIPRNDVDICNYCRMTFNYHNNNKIKDIHTNLSKSELYFFSSVNCCINTKMISPPVFNEKFPVYEDVTLSYKIISNGMRIAYCPDAAVIHSHNFTYYDILRRYFDAGSVWKRIGIFGQNDQCINSDRKRFLKHSLNILKKRSIAEKLKFSGFLFFAGLGFKLGLNYKYLPKSICIRFLSQYGTVGNAN
jgi:rhamnosyltransferase